MIDPQVVDGWNWKSKHGPKAAVTGRQLLSSFKKLVFQWWMIQRLPELRMSVSSGSELSSQDGLADLSLRGPQNMHPKKAQGMKSPVAGGRRPWSCRCRDAGRTRGLGRTGSTRKIRGFSMASWARAWEISHRYRQFTILYKGVSKLPNHPFFVYCQSASFIGSWWVFGSVTGSLKNSCTTWDHQNHCIHFLC